MTGLISRYFYHCHNIDHAGGNAVNDKIYAGHQVCGHPGLKFHHCFVKMRHDRLFQRWIVLEQFGKPQRQVININGKAVLKSQDTVQYLRNNHPEQTGDNKYKKEQAYQSGSHLPYTVPDLLGLKQPYSLFADKRIGKIIDRKHQIGQNASVDNRHQNLDDHTDHSEDIRSLDSKKVVTLQAMTASAVRPQLIYSRNLWFFMFVYSCDMF